MLAPKKCIFTSCTTEIDRSKDGMEWKEREKERSGKNWNLEKNKWKFYF